MFSGAVLINIDNKGRIAIPTRYRDHFYEGLVCTIGIYDLCLSIYPMQVWKEVEKQLSALSSVIEIERKIKRLLLGHAVECNMDTTGRILLPPTLRTYAQLDKNILFVGQSNKFEIWNEATWYNQVKNDVESIINDSVNFSDNLKQLNF